MKKDLKKSEILLQSISELDTKHIENAEKATKKTLLASSAKPHTARVFGFASAAICLVLVCAVAIPYLAKSPKDEITDLPDDSSIATQPQADDSGVAPKKADSGEIVSRVSRGIADQEKAEKALYDLFSSKGHTVTSCRYIAESEAYYDFFRLPYEEKGWLFEVFEVTLNGIDENISVIMTSTDGGEVWWRFGGVFETVDKKEDMTLFVEYPE
jgi:hypothetical protein